MREAVDPTLPAGPMRDQWTIDPDRGLWLFRASRLDALLDPLDALLLHLPPREWLAPQTVLVGHPGLRHWLRQALANRRGPGAVVANIAFALPGPWLDGLALALLGLPDAAARGWQHEVLRWRLLPRLRALDDARVQSMLADDDGTQAFALASRLASALAPLMLYRPDWLRRWARGEPAVRGDALLAAAWRALQGSGGADGRRGAPASRDDARVAHRGERLLQLAHHLNDAVLRPAGLAEDPLHVFGLHHLAPPELAVVRALSRWRPVVLHVADPCREHWLGMGSGRAAMRAALACDDIGESAFLALDHPLLAAWGRLGQHFLLALEDNALAVNERHGVDTLDPAPTTLLDRVQHSLRRNAPGLMRMASADALDALRGDASLRVLRCATPLRELEVLRDALAEAFATLPGLQPADVVVLAPDPARYRPLLPAVFGAPGQRDGVWPWHAFDVPLAASHPLYRALAIALALPGTRLTAPGLLDLLALPAVARRFSLEGEDAAVLRHALARLGVAWGLDADDRAAFDAPPSVEHTFDWGLDRALAGQVFGLRDAEVITLPDEARLLPGEGIDAGVAERLGRLHALLLEVREWTALAAASLTPGAWQTTLARRIDGLFAVAPGDDEARDALDAVRAMLAALADEWRDAGLEATAPIPASPAAPAASGLLPWPAVRDALRGRLDAVPERQRFLVGGITFAGMVPQRAIPFRVIAVLGLDEGALPRHAPEDGLELRAQAPRFGDRDLASDDRYLFLETLMAARDRLHLSFIGVGADDGRARNPAGPLADLLDTLARFVPPGGSAKPEAGWPWERQARLQPASVRDVGERGASIAARPPSHASPPTGAALATPPTLEALLAFFHDPARHALRDIAGARLDALEDERLEADEPLEPQADRREAIARRLVFAALEAGAAAPAESPDESLRLGGRLPPGALADALWREQREQALTTLGLLRTAPTPPREPLSAPRRIAVSVALDAGSTLTGEVAVRDDADGRLWLIEAVPGRQGDRLHFGRRIPLLLRWLALRLTQPDRVNIALVGSERDDDFAGRIAAMDAACTAAGTAEAREANAAALRAVLRAALDFRAAVLRGERRYLPATSWAAWRHGDDDPGRVIAAWAGAGIPVGERDHAPGYAALWGQDWHFVPGEGELARFVDDAKALVASFGALLDPAHGGDGVGGEP